MPINAALFSTEDFFKKWLTLLANFKAKKLAWLANIAKNVMGKPQFNVVTYLQTFNI